MKNKYPKLNLKLKGFSLVNPILRYYFVLQKSEPKVVFNKFLDKERIVVRRLESYPVYLPEIGKLLALDVTSKNLSKRIYESTKKFEGIYSENTLFLSKLKNYDGKTNRAVSWGQIFPHKIEEEFYDMYLNNLFNDLLTTPSFLDHKGLYSPNRWFNVKAKIMRGLRFEAEVNYNVGIVFLNRKSLDNAKKIEFWANDKMTLYEINAGFLTFKKKGKMKFEEVRIYFPENPKSLKEDISGEGDYFLCFLVSFNDYETNYSSFPYDKKFNLHIVESLLGFSYSKYDVLRMMLPEYIDDVDFSSFVFNWKVPKELVKKILERMMKFSGIKNRNLIRGYDRFIEGSNNLIRIEEKKASYNVKMINPSIVPFILKKRLSSDSDRIKSRSRDILGVEDLIEKMNELEDDSKENGWEFRVLAPVLGGVGRVLELRHRQMEFLRKLRKNK